MSGGRHRIRWRGDGVPRGLRPLTVVALCSVVAVLAVLATETTHPYTGGGTSIAATDPNDATPSDEPTDEGSTDPATDSTDQPTPGPAVAKPAPAPAPPIPPLVQPGPAPIPDPTTPTPIPSPSPSPAPPPGPVSFEAEGATLVGGAASGSCSACSGGKKVRYVGKSGVLDFTTVSWGSGGTVLLVLSYVNGDTTSRKALVSVNGGTPVTISCSSTRNWGNVGTYTLRITLKSGTNRVTISNPSGWAPDFDRITVRAP